MPLKRVSYTNIHAELDALLSSATEKLEKRYHSDLTDDEVATLLDALGGRKDLRQRVKELEVAVDAERRRLHELVSDFQKNGNWGAALKSAGLEPSDQGAEGDSIWALYKRLVGLPAGETIELLAPWNDFAAIRTEPEGEWEIEGPNPFFSFTGPIDDVSACIACMQIYAPKTPSGIIVALRRAANRAGDASPQIPNARRVKKRLQETA